MESPITDIVFVCDPDKVPEGYTAITECPCGHDAQLWEKVIGGEAGIRYLCYSKKDQGDNKVVEDMYIPGPSTQYLKKDYKIIKDTVEGQEPMHHKQLAVKKVLRSQASKVVVDMIVARSRDNISKLYTKLSKVNGLRIAFRTAQYSEGKDLSSNLGKMSLGGPNAKVQANLDEYNPSPSTSRSPTKAPSPPRKQEDSVAAAANLSSYSPSPSLKNRNRPPQEDVVQVKAVPLLSSPPPSAPPPTASPPTASPPTAPPPTAPPPTTPPPSVSPVPTTVLGATKDSSASSGQFPVSFTDAPSDSHSSGTSYPPPAAAASTTPNALYPQATGAANVGSGGPSDGHFKGTSYPPPPPAAATSTASNAPYPQTTNVGGGPPTMYPPPAAAPYPPGGGSVPPYNQPNPYQPVPQYPAYGANLTSSSFNRAAFQPAGPTSYAGYDTNIGFSFGGGGGGGGASSAPPAPYNPYHHQNPSSSTAPNYPPGAPQGNFPTAQPPGKQGQNTSYGFNF